MNVSKKYNLEKLFGTIVIVVSISGYIVWTVLDKKNAQNVKDDYAFSSGEIMSYSSSGAPESFSLKYSYRALNKSFHRSIHAPFEKFPGCEHDFSLCSGKRFWVAYEKGNPSNSLINLDIEIQGLENPKPPETLEGFK